jgi:hypothetical protein
VTTPASLVAATEQAVGLAGRGGPTPRDARARCGGTGCADARSGWCSACSPSGQVATPTLSQSGVLLGEDMTEIAEPTIWGLIPPVGSSSIWGLIYTASLVLVVYQASEAAAPGCCWPRSGLPVVPRAVRANRASTRAWSRRGRDARGDRRQWRSRRRRAAVAAMRLAHPSGEAADRKEESGPVTRFGLRGRRHVRALFNRRSGGRRMRRRVGGPVASLRSRSVLPGLLLTECRWRDHAWGRAGDCGGVFAPDARHASRQGVSEAG